MKIGSPYFQIGRLHFDSETQMTFVSAKFIHPGKVLKEKAKHIPTDSKSREIWAKTS